MLLTNKFGLLPNGRIDAQDRVAPEHVLAVFDADGVLFRAGVWKHLLATPIPSLGYKPEITPDELDRVFEKAKSATDDSGNPRYFEKDGRLNMNRLVTEQLMELMRDPSGVLPITPDVLQHIGRELPLFDNVKSTMEELADEVEEASGGTAELRIVINTCGWRDILIHAFDDLSRERPRLVHLVAGQAFTFVGPEGDRLVNLVRHIRDDHHKGDLVKRLLEELDVDPRKVLVVYDGETDLPMVEANPNGLNLQVHEPDFPEAMERRPQVRELFNARLPDHNIVSAEAVWGDGESVHEQLMRWARDLPYVHNNYEVDEAKTV